jgi:dephospho-CoA kinase
VTRVLITGMSGTGKSTVLEELSRRGHQVVDTDTEEWSHWVTMPDGSIDWVWRDGRIRSLLKHHHDGALFVAGCKTNQGEFYPLFDEVVLLSAPMDVMLARIDGRDDNPYGKNDEERELIRQHVETVEPLLRRSATHEIDTTGSIADIADQLEAIEGITRS